MADVSRLVLQVEASVELARRNISALAAAVDGDTKKMDTSLRRVDEAHTRLAKSSGSARIAQMEFMHVVTASTDAVNAGIPVSRVFAMEMGRIFEAAQLATSGTGAFAKFIGGPYGIALQLGVGLLTMLAMRHEGAGEGAKAHKSEEEKLADAIKAVTDATKHLNDNELVTIQRDLDAARAAEANATAQRSKAKGLLEAAVAFAKLQESNAEYDRSQDPNRGTAQESHASAENAASARARVQELTAQIARLDGDVAAAQRAQAETEVRFAHIIAQAQTSPERMVDFQFNQKDILLNREYRARVAGRDETAADKDWLIRKERELAEAREAAMRTAQAAAEAERRLSDNRQQGRQVTLAEAESIVRGIGGRITSAERSTATQAELYARYRAGTGSLAAPPGHSFHETGQALDIAKGPGMSLGRLVEAFRSRGIQVREQLDEGNHYHIAFGKAGPSQESVARSAQSLADTKRRDQETFAGAQAAADQRLAAAQEEAAKNAEDSLDYQIARIGKEREALDEATKRTATEHHWSQAETNVVLELNRRWAAQKVATATARDDAANARDQLQIGEAGLRTETEIARAREQLATTTKERRDSAIALLDLAQQQERLELEAVLASKEATDAQKKIAAARLAALPQLRDLAVQTIDRQYQRPGQRFLSDLNARDINEQLDEVKIHGLQTLEDELAGVVSGTESVSSAFKRMAQSIIADLARIAIEKEIVIPLANMLFGGSGGGGGGDLLAALGSSTGSLPGFASGGNPPVGRPYIVGERGPEVRIDRTPSTIIPNHLLGRGGRGSAAPPQVIVVQVDKSPYFDVSVDQRIGAAVPAIAAHAGKQVIRTITRAGING